MRGLPHCHFLLTLADRDKPKSAEKIDSIVSAEIPDEATEPELYELVKAHMVSLPLIHLAKQNDLSSSGAWTLPARVVPR